MFTVVCEFMRQEHVYSHSRVSSDWHSRENKYKSGEVRYN